MSNLHLLENLEHTGLSESVDQAMELARMMPDGPAKTKLLETVAKVVRFNVQLLGAYVTKLPDSE